MIFHKDFDSQALADMYAGRQTVVKDVMYEGLSSKQLTTGSAGSTTGRRLSF